MKIITYSILLSYLAFLTSCKSDPQRPIENKPTTVTETVNSESTTTPDISTDTKPRAGIEFKNKVTDAKEIANFRGTALSILNHRIKNNPETMAIVEADVWEYQFVYDGEMSANGVFKGVWVDFKNDHTYEYGKNSIVQGRGKYSYVLDRGELLMVDDNSKNKPNEWTVKSAGDVMILIGTPNYSDNHIQMKLGRVPDSFRQ